MALAAISDIRKGVSSKFQICRGWLEKEKKKKKKKIGCALASGEGKETPAAEPRHFTERPQMDLFPWGQYTSNVT